MEVFHVEVEFPEPHKPWLDLPSTSRRTPLKVSARHFISQVCFCICPSSKSEVVSSPLPVSLCLRLLLLRL